MYRTIISSVVSCVPETLSFTPKDGHRLTAFIYRMLKPVFQYKQKKQQDAGENCMNVMKGCIIYIPCQILL